MKLSVYFVMFVALLVNSCSGQKATLENEDGLMIDTATYSKWVAGIAGGGAGYALHIKCKENQPNLILEKVVFRNWIIDLESKDSINYYASVNDGSNNTVGTAIGESSLKSSPIIKNEEMPFEIEESECIIYYKKNGVTKYERVKLMDISSISVPR